MYKIIGADKNQYGPAPADEIRQWIREGRANVHSLVCEAEGSNWRPLGMFPEFAAALALAQTPAIAPTFSPFAAPRTNGMSLAGFIFSLLGFFCCTFGVFSILGLIFSFVGLRQIRSNPPQGGRTLAISGVILSLVTLLIWFTIISLAIYFGGDDVSGGE